MVTILFTDAARTPSSPMLLISSILLLLPLRTFVGGPNRWHHLRSDSTLESTFKAQVNNGDYYIIIKLMTGSILLLLT